MNLTPITLLNCRLRSTSLASRSLAPAARSTFEAPNLARSSAGQLRLWSPARSTTPSRLMTKAEGSLTQIPKAKTNDEAVKGALELAHDCEAAYSQAAKKAEDPELKQALEKFASQASSQADQWRGLINPPPDKESGISSSINSFKVKLANLGGDSAIVKAIFNNSNDSATAYSAVSQRSDFSSQTTQLAGKLLPQAEEQRAFFEKWQAAR